MHRYRAYLLAFFLPLLLAGLAFCMAALSVFGYPTPDNYWVAEGYRIKLRLAAAAPTPKILIVGGSNAYFGLRAEDIEAATGRRSINFAMHGGLSFDYTAFLARRVLARGDTVILALEYPYFEPLRGGMFDTVNTLTASTALSFGFGYLFTLPPVEQLSFLRHIHFRRLADGLHSRLHPMTTSPWLYQVSGLNRWGDETLDYRNATTAAELRRELVDTVTIGAPVVDLSAPAVRSLQEFLGWCRDNGVTVLATWPNAVDSSPLDAAGLAAPQAKIGAFYAAEGVPMIGTPEDARLPVPLMLDTLYHPNLDGAVWRTRRLVAALCRETDLCTPRRPETGTGA